MMNTKEQIIIKYINKFGPIKTVRVSSAQAKGLAKKYPYWGAVRYNLIVTKSGHISNIACERATSDRRSLSLAEDDADQLAESENRLHINHIGRISDEVTLNYILKNINIADKMLI